MKHDIYPNFFHKNDKNERRETKSVLWTEKNEGGIEIPRKKTPKRQKQYYKKTNELSTKELKERKETVKTGLTKTLLIAKTNLWHNSGHFFSNFRVTSYTTPLIFFMSFVSWGESSRKWKCQSNDRLYKRIGKSERERVLEEKQRNPSKVCTSNEKAKAIWSI